jgi:hypothetical protein
MTFMTFLRENLNLPEEKQQPSTTTQPSSLNFKSIANIFERMQTFFDSIIPDSRFGFFKFPFLLCLLTLAYIILFRTDDNNIRLRFFKSNEHIFVPLLMAIYGVVLYKSYGSSYFDYEKGEFNKIKSIILFFCVLATIINFFVTDPGQFISTHFKSATLLLILATVVLFFQTSVDLLDGVYIKKGQKGAGAGSHFLDFLSNPKYQIINYICNFLVVFILTTLTMYYYSTSSRQLFIKLLTSTIIITILWSSFSTMLYFHNNPNIKIGNIPSPANIKQLLQLILLLLLLIITTIWVSYFIFNSSSFTSLGKISSILIMCILLSIVYKYIHSKLHNGKSIDRLSTFVDVLYNIVFWLPCLVTDVLQYIFSLGRSNLFSTVDTLSIAIVSTIIGIIFLYTNAKKFNETIASQNGNVIISTPSYLNEEVYFPFPIEEHKQTDFALSFWCYFHSTPTVTKNVYSIINICDNECNVSYHPQENAIYIGHKKKVSASPLETYTENNIPLVFKEKMVLQKWNNVILNFSNSSLDVFINGQLKHSEGNIMSTFNKELLKIGEHNGIQGGIRQFTSYNKPLTFFNIFMINNTPNLIR